MEQYFSKNEIENLEVRYKGNLINSISGYKSANLIGTINKAGISNLSIVSSVIHLGSDPALMGFIMRPTSVPRHTYNNLKNNGSFTINQVHENIMGKAHFSSARFEEEESEFAALELTEEYQQDFPAPFVKASHIKIGLKFEDEKLISNGCRLIIGSIQHLIISSSALKKDGSLNLEVIDTVAVAGLNKYYTGKFMKEFPYAKKKDIEEYLTKKPKERPDNVVFNEDTKRYDAGLKAYNTNVGAPSIQHQNLGKWKRIGSTKVNHHLETKFEHIKSQYQDVLDIYEWNQKIYDSKFNFEPITGMNYHLYEKVDGSLFLSIIDPSDWNKKHLGSFKLDEDRIFRKLDPNQTNIII